MQQTKKRKSHSFKQARKTLNSILSIAVTAQQQSKDVNTRINTMREDFSLPQYAWNYLSGYASAVRERWYFKDLVYAVNYEGTVYKMDWDNLPEFVKDYLRKTPTSEQTSGHYWLNKDGTVGRPYFIS